MSEDLNNLIVEALVEQRNRSDIITAVCERTGLDWKRAEELVDRVEKERAHAVAAGQAPILIFLSACISIAGLLLVGFSAWSLAEIARGNALGLIILLAANPQPVWGGVLGLAMLAGGAIGMYRLALRYFETR